MKVNPSRTRIWRSQHLKSIELVHGVSQNHSLPRHFHEELELGIRQGDGWQFNYRGARHSVPSNTLVVTQPGETHEADCASDQDTTYRGLQVGVDLLQQVAIEVAGRDIKLPLFPMPLVHDRDFNTKFIQVHQAIERSTSQLEQQTLTLDLLAQLILRYAETPPYLAKLGTEIQPVHRVRDYLEEHSDQEISLEQLSQIANLSPFHLNRSFSKTFGMPPHAYQIQMRIIRASHFGSHFKRLVCVTPKQYIQDSKNVISFEN
jgi:AraC-like DNA-binding protein